MLHGNPHLLDLHQSPEVYLSGLSGSGRGWETLVGTPFVLVT